MADIEQLVNGLTDQNDKHAYNCLRQLTAISEQSNEVYRYFDVFAQMLTSANSYIRTRGFLLIAANAERDEDCKIDEIIDTCLQCIRDAKPIAARQCIKVLPHLAKRKPELKQDIVRALHRADISIYTGSMQPLVYKNIRECLAKIAEET